MERELRPDAAAGYLADANAPVGEVVRATALGGGVSNVVVEVRTADGDCLVLKQPRPNLAVEDDWPADVARVHNEAAAARAYERILAERGLDARVPTPRFEDETDHVVGFECAPEEATMWKEDLLAGRVDGAVARAVGEVLGAVHDAAAGDEDLRASFASKRPFEQLRVDPYHRTTAERHPDLAERIRAEAERVTDVERTLVHGDYSPKNVLVDGGTPWILDFEVAHWGDPSFDTAFMLNHLFIKSVHNRERGAAYREAASAFWRAYDAAVPWDVEPETVAELGVLLLARVDGKSPVEYVDEATADALRRCGTRLLREEVDSLDAAASVVAAEADRLESADRVAGDDRPDRGDRDDRLSRPDRDDRAGTPERDA